MGQCACWLSCIVSTAVSSYLRRCGETHACIVCMHEGLLRWQANRISLLHMGHAYPPHSVLPRCHLRCGTNDSWCDDIKPRVDILPFPLATASLSYTPGPPSLLAHASCRLPHYSTRPGRLPLWHHSNRIRRPAWPTQHCRAGDPQRTSSCCWLLPPCCCCWRGWGLPLCACPPEGRRDGLVAAVACTTQCCCSRGPSQQWTCQHGSTFSTTCVRGLPNPAAAAVAAAAHTAAAAGNSGLLRLHCADSSTSTSSTPCRSSRRGSCVSCCPPACTRCGTTPAQTAAAAAAAAAAFSWGPTTGNSAAAAAGVGVSWRSRFSHAGCCCCWWWW